MGTDASVKIMDYSIRRATLHDLEEIVALVHSCFPDILSDNDIEITRRQAASQNTVSFVACDNTRIIGYAAIISAFEKEGNPQLQSLAVLPEYRQNGLAHALTAARIAYLEQWQFQGILHGEAITTHCDSQRTFAKQGFYPTQLTIGNTRCSTSQNYLSTLRMCRSFLRQKPPIDIYLPSEYRELAQRTVSPFADIAFRETTRTKPLKTIKKDPKTYHLLALDSPSTPANIDFLLQHDHYVGGFFPLMENGKMRLYVPVFPFPRGNIHPVHVLPAAQPLADFVWEQYAMVRT